jgi:GTP-binding protein LepA
VSYYCKLRGQGDSEDNGLIKVDNPADCPLPEKIAYWKECIVRATIITPRDYLKGIKDLCEQRRGHLLKEDFMNNGNVVSLYYDMPLSEMITDFFDMMKSLS